MGAVGLTLACSTRAGAPFSNRWVLILILISVLFFFFSFFFSNPFLNIPHFIKHWTSLSRFFAQTYLHIFVLASHFVLSKIQRSFFQKIFFSSKHSCICFSPVLKLKKNIWYCNWRFKLSRLHSIVLLEYVGFHF